MVDDSCTNVLTIICEDKPTMIDSIIKDEFSTDSLPVKSYKVKTRGHHGFVVEMNTNWRPDTEWLNYLVKKYPLVWVKNEWYEESGMAGIYVNGYLDGSVVEPIDIYWKELSKECKANILIK
jgi:hypothetical protein